MKKVTSAKIIRTANKLVKEGKKWHFHILAPGCVFNKNKIFALILEDTEKKTQMVHFSFKRPSKTGQMLVELLHGKGISKAEKKLWKVKSDLVSPKVMKMIERAKELNLKGFSWHHHLLFPECIFNEDSRYWTLIFEDPINGEVIKDKSKSEPKKALKKIEPLFYIQKK